MPVLLPAYLLKDSQALTALSILGSMAAMIVVFMSILLHIDITCPKLLRKPWEVLKWPFQPFLSTNEALTMLSRCDMRPSDETGSQVATGTIGRSDVFLSSLGLVMANAWAAAGAYQLRFNPDEPIIVLCYPFVMAATWIYCFIRPLARPVQISPLDILMLSAVHLTISVLHVGIVISNKAVFNVPISWIPMLATQVCQLGIALTAISFVLLYPSDRLVASLEIDGSPEDGMTLWGGMAYSWLRPLLSKGQSGRLDEADVPSLSVVNRSTPVYEQFKRVPGATLFRRLLVANRKDILYDILINMVAIVFKYGSAVTLYLILDALLDQSFESRWRAGVLAAVQLSCILAKSQADAIHLYYGRRAATRVRQELISSILNRIIARPAPVSDPRLEKRGSRMKRTKRDRTMPWMNTPQTRGGAKREHNVDLNTLQSDSNRVVSFVSSLFILFGAPIEIAIGCTFLVCLLGRAAVSGFAVLLIVSVLNHIISQRGVNFGKALRDLRDKRLELLAEFMPAIKSIKLFSWEDIVAERVHNARNAELDALTKDKINSIIFSFSSSLAPALASALSFLTLTIIQHHELDPPVAFTTIVLFGMMRSPFSAITSFASQRQHASNACSKIDEFLGQDGSDSSPSTIQEPPRQDWRLGIKGATFIWPEQTRIVTDSTIHPTSFDEERKFALVDVSILFPARRLSVITGPTGSGKTALLRALIGEMPMMPGGTVYTPHEHHCIDENGFTNSISYCAQNPWLDHSSIRDNILFGSPLNESRYAEVIRCCGLSALPTLFKAGDQTDIRLRDANIDASVKARIGIARAVYDHARNVLIDDVFAFIDPVTARTICMQLFNSPLVEGRTVVVATSNTELIQSISYYLVRLRDRRIDFHGDVARLHDDGRLETPMQLAPEKDNASYSHVLDATDTAPVHSEEADDGSNGPMPRQGARFSGNFNWKAYRSFLGAWPCSYFLWAIVLLFVCVKQLLSVAEKFWLREWTRAYQDTRRGDREPRTQALVSPGDIFNLLDLSSVRNNPVLCMAVYAGITLGGSTAGAVSGYIASLVSSKTSRILFRETFEAVMETAMIWFNVAPQGRILHRMGSDFVTFDMSLGTASQGLLIWSTTFAASVITITAIYPPFILAALVIVALYLRLAFRYVPTACELRRLESTSRWAMIGFCSNVVEGMSIIRCLGAERHILTGLHGKLDTTTKMWHNYWMLNRYLLLRCEFLCAFATASVAGLVLHGGLDSGTAGIILTSAMSLAYSAYWTSRQMVDLQLDTFNVEHLLDPDVTPGGSKVAEAQPAPAAWPSASIPVLVSVRDLVVTNPSKLDNSIDRITFDLRPRERVALVGRHGSGKSMLALSLMKFIDATSGEISIDGLDISSLDMKELRSRFSVVPEQVGMFSGTLRDNLDPHDEYSDEELVHALIQAQPPAAKGRKVSRVFAQLPSQAQFTRTSNDTGDVAPKQHYTAILETVVDTAGHNFTQAERRIFALARAILRQSPILIVDEETITTDSTTEMHVHSTLRDHFPNSLVLCIVHRLRTAIYYDRIIVLEGGTIVEDGMPRELLERDGGAFRAMCIASGEYEQLYAAASDGVNGPLHARQSRRASLF